MNKSEILEIASKNKNDDYLKDVRINGGRLGMAFLLISMLIFLIVDFVKGNPMDYRFFILVFVMNFISETYIFIKTKDKRQILSMLVWFLIAVQHIIRYVMSLR